MCMPCNEEHLKAVYVNERAGGLSESVFYSTLFTQCVMVKKTLVVN